MRPRSLTALANARPDWSWQRHVAPVLKAVMSAALDHAKKAGVKPVRWVLGPTAWTAVVAPRLTDIDHCDEVVAIDGVDVVCDDGAEEMFVSLETDPALEEVIDVG